MPVFQQVEPTVILPAVHMGKRLLAARERAGWSREDVAARWDIPLDVIPRIEAGDAIPPRASRAIRLAVTDLETFPPYGAKLDTADTEPGERPVDERKAFGQGIRARRIALQWGVKDLAARVGASASVVYAIEGANGSYSAATAQRVLDALGRGEEGDTDNQQETPVPTIEQTVTVPDQTIIENAVIPGTLEEFLSPPVVGNTEPAVDLDAPDEVQVAPPDAPCPPALMLAVRIASDHTALDVLLAKLPAFRGDLPEAVQLRWFDSYDKLVATLDTRAAPSSKPSDFR